MTISELVTEANKKVNNMALTRISYIYYLLYFTNKVQALLDLDSKVNAMMPVYSSKLGFQICHTNVRAEKIDSFIYKIFKWCWQAFR